MKNDVFRFAFVAGLAVATVNVLDIVAINWWYDIALFAIAYFNLLKSLVLKIMVELIALPVYYISFQPRNPKVEYEVYMVHVYYQYYRLVNKLIDKLNK